MYRKSCCVTNHHRKVSHLDYFFSEGNERAKDPVRSETTVLFIKEYTYNIYIYIYILFMVMVTII